MHDQPIIFPDGVTGPLTLHLVMQMCDVANHQSDIRICGDDRTLLSKKSLRSFLDSVSQASAARPQAKFYINLILDGCTVDLQQYCDELCVQYSAPSIVVQAQDLAPRHGLSDSIKSCYEWIQQHGQQIVGQFQDDYIFYPHAIDDVIAVLLQTQIESHTDAVVCHFQYSAFWRELYHNSSTPRALIIGRKDYWIQIYDTPCTFVTTHAQFSQHWDLYEIFFHLCKLSEELRGNSQLESQSLNLMFTRRAVLGVSPMRSLSHHVQGPRELDPHQDWRQLWDKISVSTVS